MHVDRERFSAKFWLQPVALAANHGYAAHELKEIARLIESRKDELLEAWHGHLGHER